ncbi:MAG: C40 family peptidase [Myxococcales bacterium]|nr:C40 family peptidase [Myxococcales bacterium]
MERWLCLFTCMWVLVGCSHQTTVRRANPYLVKRSPAPVLPPAVIAPPVQTPSSPGPADEETWALRKKIVSIAQRGFGKSRIACGAGMRLRRDCSGWVRCVYSHMRLDLMRPPETTQANGVLLMKRFVQHFGTFHKAQIPALGDLVFWHYTYDKNHNGLLDDLWTHIGIVEHVDDNGRVAVLHYDGVVKRAYMHLGKPGIHIDPILAAQPAPVSPACAARRQRYEACYKRYGKRGCRWKRARMKQVCQGSSPRTDVATLNSFLVNPRKAGVMYGKYTGELFGGFGTVLQTPLPFHLRRNANAVSKLPLRAAPRVPAYTSASSFLNFP